MDPNLHRGWGFFIIKMYKFSDKHICEECLYEHFPTKAERIIWRSITEVDYLDSKVKKVQSTLDRADPNRNDNEHERKIAQRQADKMMQKYDMLKVVCDWCNDK